MVIILSALQRRPTDAEDARWNAPSFFPGPLRTAQFQRAAKETSPGHEEKQATEAGHKERGLLPSSSPQALCATTHFGSLEDTKTNRPDSSGLFVKDDDDSPVNSKRKCHPEL